MRLPHARLLALGLLALASPNRAQDGPPLDARALFLTNCATCHGETGDGHGTTQLDRPARSFKDGGFSFGNTPEALFRTLSVGIPGTPMPAFGESLTEDARRALAGYVLTLGPPVTEVTRDETRLLVGQRPQIVRGLLPALVDGGERWPRGLLVGTPDGMSFEYRADDVRLLGVRQGDFLERQDWNGRGGSALAPLGQLVHLVEAGRPEPGFRLGERPLRAELEGTTVEGREALVRYRLTDEDGRTVAHVREAPRAVGTALGAGFARRFELRAAAGAEGPALRFYSGRREDVIASGAVGGRDEYVFWCALRRPAGPVEWIALRSCSHELALGPTAGFVRLAPGREHLIELTTLLVTDWKVETSAALLEALQR